ncbi:MAG: hypothetical protein JXA28_04170, partial [Bacteroidetes bacterium]|nr:hypothetical protein [Bacteroidota bacterium]
MKRILPLLLCSFFLVTACSEDDSGTTPVIPKDSPRTLYILNEGSFQRSNASLSMYLPDSNRVINDVFKNAAGRALGDVGNSLTVHDGKLWIVVNNSNRIEVLNLEDNSFVRSIECPEGASPRHIVFDDAGTGYISNLYRNSVSVYDPASGSFTAEIPVGLNPEGLALSNGRLYVANSGFGADRSVSVIDPATKQVERTLTVGDNPTTLLPLGDNGIAVLCTGAYNDFNDPNDDTPGKLFIIDTQERAVVDSLELGGHPMRLARDESGHLYTVDGSITRIHLASKSVTKDFIPGFFYNVFVDVKDG